MEKLGNLRLEWKRANERTWKAKKEAKVDTNSVSRWLPVGVPLCTVHIFVPRTVPSTVTGFYLVLLGFPGVSRSFRVRFYRFIDIFLILPSFT